MRVEMFKKKKKDSYYGGKTFEKKYFSNCLHKYLTNGPKVEEILHMAYNLTKKKTLEQSQASPIGCFPFTKND